MGVHYLKFGCLSVHPFVCLCVQRPKFFSKSFYYVISVLSWLYGKCLHCYDTQTAYISLCNICLYHYDTQTLLIIIIPGVSTLLLYLECLPYYDILVKLVEFCLSYSDRQSVYVVMISGPRFFCCCLCYYDTQSVYIVTIPGLSILLRYLRKLS